MEKTLWLVMGPNANDLLKRAKYIGARNVCVRTDNGWLRDSIAAFHQASIRVYAWRWPAIQPVSAVHRYAPEEANFAVKLIAAGLDGYIADPEADDGRDEDNWNDKKWTKLASDFCGTIDGAGRAKKADFLFGTTSGCTYPQGMPNIPWAEFTTRSQILLPQMYWRNEDGDINGKSPKAAYELGSNSWKRIVAPGNRILPMMGDINYVRADEIAEFGRIILAEGHTEMHIYASSGSVSDANWAAIRDIGGSVITVAASDMALASIKLPLPGRQGGKAKKARPKIRRSKGRKSKAAKRKRAREKTKKTQKKRPISSRRGARRK